MTKSKGTKGKAAQAEEGGSPVPPVLGARAFARREPVAFDFRPDALWRGALARELGLLDLPSLRLCGDLRPSGRHDFALVARLSGAVVQPCIVTLAPVRTPLDEEIHRHFIAHWQEPQGQEIEMGADENREPLPKEIDIEALLREALSLALPLYPRAEGAAFGRMQAAPPGSAPLSDEETKPFAALAALRTQLEQSEAAPPSEAHAKSSAPKSPKPPDASKPPSAPKTGPKRR